MKKNIPFSVIAAALLMLWSFSALAAKPHAHAPAPSGIQDIRVEGNQRIESSTIVSYTDLRKGDPFDQALLDRALKNLYATGLFSDVSLYQQETALVVKVAENAIINEIQFEGNKKIKSDDLQSEIQMKPRQVLTRTKVQMDVDRIQEMYRVSGRFSAVVDPKIIKLDQNRVNLVFEITEGPETKISRISFVGNEKYSDDQLQKVIRSREDRWYRFWTSDDKYDPDRLAYDRELLRKFYLEHGYVDFNVQTALAELSPDRRDFFVTFSIEEGERYKVGKVDIQSNVPDLNGDTLKNTVTFKVGDWYKASTLESTVTKMTTELGNRQFAFVDIQSGVERHRESRTVDVHFTVNEGQKTFIENINISGNSRTLDEVVRREMTLIEGDPFNTDKIKKSEQRIKDLGYFEKVDVKPQPGSSPNKTNIDVKVEEKSTGELSVGAGYSTTDGPLADFKVSERNFLGKGQQLQFDTTLAAKRTAFNFSFTEPYFLKRDLSAGIDLFDTVQDLQSQSSYDSQRMGGGLRLGYPLSEHWRQNLAYRYDQSDITNVQATASTYIRQQAGTYITSLVSQSLTYDARDSKIDPTEGPLFRITTDLAGLGGEARYFRGRVLGTYYYPVIDHCVFSALGETGYIHGLTGKSIRIDERFFLGGDNLRGFDDSGVGPRDMATSDSLGGNMFWRGSAELDFPVGLPEDFGVRGHGFSDAGSLWSVDQTGATIKDVNSVRMSLGAGISWRSPMGPVRMDWAKPVRAETYDKKRIFRFSFGTRF